MLVIFRVVSPSKSSAEAKVCQLDVTVGVNQDIVRFDVSVDETHLVNTVHCANQLADVKPGERNSIQILKLANLKYLLC